MAAVSDDQIRVAVAVDVPGPCHRLACALDAQCQAAGVVQVDGAGGAAITRYAPPKVPSARATLNVKARKKTRKVKPTARTRLVRSVTVGTGQKARVTVKVLPKKARDTVTVRKTRKRVVVRTRNTPRKTRIRVRITSRAPDHFTRTWTRTWRVR